MTSHGKKINLAIAFPSTRLCRLVIGLCALSVMAVSSRAQGPQLPEPPLPVDPRPIAELISAADKALLAGAHNPKKLVEVYLKISDTHLQAALAAIKAGNPSTAERELDIYNKAVAEAAKNAFGLREGKRGVSKKVEQVLYKQIRILEAIDRLFPAEREAFSDAALKHSKQVRVQALNEAFAAGDVLKDPSEEKKPESEPPAKETPPTNSTIPSGLSRWSVKFNPTGPVDEYDDDVLRSNLKLYRLRPDGNLDAERTSMQMPGDYLTEEEDNHVREAQAADDRVKVFMKIADRRIKALSGPAAVPLDKKEQKKAEEEEREWGALAKVSRVELLRHYARAISECLAKLEDAYERNPKSSSIPKALAMLRDATERHLQTLRTLTPETKTESEIAALREAISEAEIANKGARDGLK